MLKRIWEGWKRFGQRVGDIFARVVLTIFYFTIFMPFGLGVRFFSDPLAIKTRPADLWMARSTRDKTMADARRQF